MPSLPGSLDISECEFDQRLVSIILSTSGMMMKLTPKQSFLGICL